jgi:hypothetical protein
MTPPFAGPELPRMRLDKCSILQLLDSQAGKYCNGIRRRETDIMAQDVARVVKMAQHIEAWIQL